MNAVTKVKEAGTVVSAPQVHGEDAWLSMIERAAKDPTVDVSKMERMFEMRERVMKADAIQAFNAAFVAVKSTVGPIVRNKRNSQTDSNYADLAAVADAVDETMAQNGFGITFGTGTSDKEGYYRVTGELLHAQGHSKEYYADIPVDDAGIKGTKNKTATHAFGSTMSYGRRYLKIAIFDLATKDDDGNDAGGRADPEFITDEDVVDLQTMVANAGADLPKFLTFLKVPSLADLPANKLEYAKQALKAKQKEAAK